MKTGIRALPLPHLIAAAAIAVGAWSRLAWAEWPPFGRAVCTADDSQTHPAIATDGRGGAIVAWQDDRGDTSNLFAQHLLPNGEVDPAWPVDGRALLGDRAALPVADGGQTGPVIVPDGRGGAIVCWEDLRDDTTDTNVFAQHVLASGRLDPAWPANGAALCSIAGVQRDPAMIPDGSGGAIVAWKDSRPGATVSDIYAQRVTAAGVVDPAWPVNGLAVVTAEGAQDFPSLVASGSGGAIVLWQDLRDPADDFDVFATRVLPTGTVDPAWPVNGRALCTAPGGQGIPTIAPDGADGAIVAWGDFRLPAQSHIFAAHVFASGVVDPAWPVNGVQISDAAPLETRALAVPDGAGGAIVTWQALDTKMNMAAQHVTAGGIVDPAWPAGGRALSVTDRLQTNASIVPDDSGGAVVVWEEDEDIVAQHVLASGALDAAYPATGRVVCGLPGQQVGPVLVATGAGGAIAAWTDTRNPGTSPDIYAMQVLEATAAIVPDPTPTGIAFGRPGPNPARGSVMLRFSLPREAPASLAIYDVRGRRVRVLASGPRPAGAHAIPWDLRDDRGRAVGAGFYFARLEAEGRTFTAKISTLR